MPTDCKMGSSLRAWLLDDSDDQIDRRSNYSASLQNGRLIYISEYQGNYADLMHSYANWKCLELDFLAMPIVIQMILNDQTDRRLSKA